MRALAHAAEPHALLPTARTLDEAAVNLIDLGYTRLHWPSLPARFPGIIQTYTELTQGPDAKLLEILSKRELHQDGKSNLGLRFVRKGEVKENPRRQEIAEGRISYDETKFYYHANQRTLGYFATRGDLLERHRDFFFQTATVNGECVLLGLELADRMDRLMPGYDFAKRMWQAEQDAVSRFLRYLCDGEKPNIAQVHRDQNFLTIHIRSDRPQLWLADGLGNVIPDAQETRDDSVLIFLSYKAWAMTQGQLPAIAHGVRDPLFGQSRQPRHTAVTFLHITLTVEEKLWGDSQVTSFSPDVTAYDKSGIV